MYDPDGIGDPLYFCSSSCLYSAEHIFDGFEQKQLEQLDMCITTAEASSKVLS
jgi:hypothetical protein